KEKVSSKKDPINPIKGTPQKRPLHLHLKQRQNTQKHYDPQTTLITTTQPPNTTQLGVSINHNTALLPKTTRTPKKESNRQNLPKGIMDTQWIKE
ncbi:hypothetical protein GIB67_010742, partial [Kingdonia uniflora]